MSSVALLVVMINFINKSLFNGHAGNIIIIGSEVLLI